MTSLRMFVAVVATLFCGQMAGDATNATPQTAVLAVCGLVLGFGLLSKVSALSIAKSSWCGMQNPASGMCARFQTNRRWLETLWAVALPLTLLSSGWSDWTQLLKESGCPHSLVVCLLFLPSLCLIILIEMTAAQLDEFAIESAERHTSQGILPSTGRSAGQGATQRSWQRIWWLRIRLGEMSHLLMCLAPVFVFALWSDLLQACGGGLTEVQLTAGAALLGGSTVLLCLPSALGRWMGVVPLEDQELLNRLDKYRAAAGVRRLEAVVVPSCGRWSGAAVVGWLPGFRKLWLGDVLVDQLDSQQLDMIILHEIAHVKRLHFVWRCLPILWTLALLGAYRSLSEPLSPALIPPWLAGGTCFAIGAGALLLGIGQVSRSCELDADLEACRLARSACEWTQDHATDAEEILAKALRSVMGHSTEASRRSWLHPSLRERIRSLARAKYAQNSG